MGQSVATFPVNMTGLDPTGPEAGADLSSSQFHIVKADGTLAGAGEGYAVLQNAPGNGQPMSACVFGITKVKCGGTIARTGAFKSDASAQAVAATSSGDAPLGYVLEDATSGDVVWAFVCLNTAEVN